jgi:hypothetical protein
MILLGLAIGLDDLRALKLVINLLWLFLEIELEDLVKFEFKLEHARFKIKHLHIPMLIGRDDVQNVPVLKQEHVHQEIGETGDLHGCFLIVHLISLRRLRQSLGLFHGFQVL